MLIVSCDNAFVLVQKSSGGVLLPKSAVKFERYLTGEVRLSRLSFAL